MRLKVSCPGEGERRRESRASHVEGAAQCGNKEEKAADTVSISPPF